MPHARILSIALICAARAMLPDASAHAQADPSTVTTPPAISVSFLATRGLGAENLWQRTRARADSRGCAGFDGLPGHVREQSSDGPIHARCAIIMSSMQDEAREGRGEVALRGLFWGAVIGGLVGWSQRSAESHFGAVGSVVAGAVVGAPIGMVVFLLITPL